MQIKIHNIFKMLNLSQKKLNWNPIKFNDLNIDRTKNYQYIYSKQITSKFIEEKREILENDTDLIFYFIFQLTIIQNYSNMNINKLVNWLTSKIENDFQSIDWEKLTSTIKIFGEQRINNEEFWSNLEIILNIKNNWTFFNINQLINIIEGFNKVGRLLNLKYINNIKSIINSNWGHISKEQKEIYLENI